ncbi:MAG TPA: glycine betaine ABC transporter substrate-binding protein [Egibacteraceae bacterium]|nr:glycine betaine ABC transporter substrate-binding protein [Egibacteraceae bacterium]
MRMRTLVAVVALGLVAGAGCQQSDAEQAADIVLGAGSTQEQRLLAAMTVAALERAGITVDARLDLGDTRGLRREAMGGRIDLYWDYTGAAWALGLRQESPVADVDESFELVRSADRGRGLEWLTPTQANATLALFVRAESLSADDAGEDAGGMQWLARTLSRGDASLCADSDFIARPGGLDDFATLYGINLEQLDVVAASEAEAIDAVAAGECFAGLATATSGAARLNGLAPVADDRKVFPAFVVAPVARARVLDRVEGLDGALRAVSERLRTEDLAELNGLVAAGGDIEQVAQDYVNSVLGPVPT